MAFMATSSGCATSACGGERMRNRTADHLAAGLAAALLALGTAITAMPPPPSPPSTGVLALRVYLGPAMARPPIDAELEARAKLEAGDRRWSWAWPTREEWAGDGRSVALAARVGSGWFAPTSRPTGPVLVVVCEATANGVPPPAATRSIEPAAALPPPPPAKRWLGDLRPRVAVGRAAAIAAAERGEPLPDARSALSGSLRIVEVARLRFPRAPTPARAAAGWLLELPAGVARPCWTGLWWGDGQLTKRGRSAQPFAPAWQGGVAW